MYQAEVRRGLKYGLSVYTINIVIANKAPTVTPEPKRGAGKLSAFHPAMRDEELGIDVEQSCLAPHSFASHDCGDFHLLMPLYVCRIWNGVASAREGQELKWVRPQHLRDYPMPPADAPPGRRVARFVVGGIAPS